MVKALEQRGRGFNSRPFHCHVTRFTVGPFVYPIETNKQRIKLFHSLCMKCFGEIPTASPLNRASNTGGVRKIAIFDQYFLLYWERYKTRPWLQRETNNRSNDSFE